jgi:cytochrome P450
VTVFRANIVASEGEEWKKYRKIAAPAFSEVRSDSREPFVPNAEQGFQKNNKLVWDENIRIVMDLFDRGDRSEVVVDHCVDITLPVRLLWLI